MVCSAARSLSLCCRQIFFVPSLLLRGLLLGEMTSLSNDTPESTLPALLIFSEIFLIYLAGSRVKIFERIFRCSRMFSLYLCMTFLSSFSLGPRLRTQKGWHVLAHILFSLFIALQSRVQKRSCRHCTWPSWAAAKAARPIKTICLVRAWCGDQKKILLLGGWGAE